MVKTNTIVIIGGLLLVAIIIFGVDILSVLQFGTGRADNPDEFGNNACKTGNIIIQNDAQGVEFTAPMKLERFVLQVGNSGSTNKNDLRVTLDGNTVISGGFNTGNVRNSNDLSNVINPKLKYVGGGRTEGSVLICTLFGDTQNKVSIGHNYEVTDAPELRIQPQTCSDGVKNQNEDFIDCGGVCGGDCDKNIGTELDLDQPIIPPQTDFGETPTPFKEESKIFGENNNIGLIAIIILGIIALWLIIKRFF